MPGKFGASKVNASMAFGRNTPKAGRFIPGNGLRSLVSALSPRMKLRNDDNGKSKSVTTLKELS